VVKNARTVLNSFIILAIVTWFNELVSGGSKKFDYL